MKAVLSEMRVLKGTGVGEEPVMGHLVNITSDGKNIEDGKLSEWDRFVSSSEEGISRLEEAIWYLEGRASRNTVSRISDQLAVLCQKSFFSEVKKYIRKGMTAIEALERVKVKNAGNCAITQACCLIKHILRGFSEDIYIDMTDIAVSDMEGDAVTLVSLERAGALGLVCVGDGKGLAAEIAEELSFPVLFVEDDMTERYNGKERAVLDPAKDSLFISPEIDIVDTVSSSLKSARERNVCENDELFGGFVLTKTKHIVSGRERREEGYALERCVEDESEEELFDAYRQLAERLEGKKITVCIRSSERMYESIRAVYRASVYGNINVAVLAKDPAELEEFRRQFMEVSSELDLEDREFNRDMRIGALVNDIAGILFAEAFSDIADFVLIDPSYISASVGDKYHSFIREKFLNMAVDRFKNSNMEEIVFLE